MKKQPASSSPAKKKPTKSAGTKKVQKKTGNFPREEKTMDWEAVFRAIGSPAVILAPDHTILSANDATCHISGKTEAELRGMKCWEVFHGQDATHPPEGCPMVRLLASGKHETAEMEVAMNGGVCLVSCTPVFDTGGAISSVIHIATDITEKKKTERILLENEDRFRKIFENSPLGMALVTPDFRFFSVNPAWISMTGYSEKELLKMSYQDITHPAHLAGDLLHIRDLAAGKIPVYTTEKRYIRKDRSILWGMIRVTAIRDPKGSLQHFAAQIENITGRKRAEEDLLEQNRALATLNQLAIEFASLSSGKSVSELAVKKLMLLSGVVATTFSEYDPSERILQVTDFEIAPGMLEKTVRLLGKRPDDMKIPVSTGMYRELVSTIVGTRKTLTEMSFGEISPLVGTGIQKMTGISHFMGIAYVVEGELYGTSVIAIKRGHPDPPTGFLESFAHIVALSLRRYRAEEKLAESEKRYRNIIAETQAGYFQIDSEGKFTSVNPAWLRMHGFSSEDEVIGKHFSTTQVDTDQAAAQKSVEHLLQGGKIPDGEFSRRRKDGSVGYHSFSASPVVKNGKIVGLEGFLIDTTGRKEAEEALRESEERYRTMLDQAADAVLMHDGAGRILDANRKACENIGCSREELLSLSVADLDPEAIQAGKNMLWDRVLAGERFTFESRQKRRDGSTFPVEVSLGPVRLPHGPVVLGIIRDITERKRAGDELKELSAYNRSLIEASLDPLVTISPGGKIQDVNTATEKVTGLPRDKLIGTDFSDYFTEPVRAREGYRRVFSEGMVFDYPLEIRHCDGHTVPVLYNATLYRDRDGNVTGVFAAARDITERKRAGDLMYATLQRLDTLISQLNTGLMMVSDDGKVEDVNQALCDLYGITDSPVSLRGLSSQEMIRKIQDAYATPADVSARIRELTARGMPVTDYEIILRNGRVVLVDYIPIIDADGKRRGRIWHHQDITKRRKAEDLIRVSEEKYRLLAETSPEMIYFIDNDGYVKYINQAAARSFHAAPDDLVGKHLSEIFPPETAQGHLEALRETMATRRVIRREITEEFPAGRVDIEVRLAPVVDKQDHVVGVLGLSNDITQRKQAEEQRERLISELAQKNLELDRFTYTVSHDLKSPLVTIRGFLSLLEKDLKSGDSARVTADILRISESSEKLEHLITTLLALSRSGRSVDTPVSIPFSDLVREAGSMLETTLKQRDVSLVFPDNLPVISGDRQRLLQVMTNLLDNAVKFMGNQTEPRVEVGVRSGTGLPVFFVKDNGMGFKSENLQKVFGLYERFNPDIPGTGIGLATVKRIIEAHGGKIWVESEGEGKGTTVCFTLSLKDDDAEKGIGL